GAVPGDLISELGADARTLSEAYDWGIRAPIRGALETAAPGWGTSAGVQDLFNDPTYQAILRVQGPEAAHRWAEERYGIPFVTGLVDQVTDPLSWVGGSGAASAR